MNTATDALEAIAIGCVAITNASLEEAGGRALSVEQWRVLFLVGEGNRGRRISEIAQHVAVTLPATSRLLRRLARRGLVGLEPDPQDARATLCRLSPAGVALRHAVLQARRGRLRAIARQAHIGPEEEDVLARLARLLGSAA